MIRAAVTVSTMLVVGLAPGEGAASLQSHSSCGEPATTSHTSPLPGALVRAALSATCPKKRTSISDCTREHNVTDRTLRVLQLQDERCLLLNTAEPHNFAGLWNSILDDDNDRVRLANLDSGELVRRSASRNSNASFNALTRLVERADPELSCAGGSPSTREQHGEGQQIDGRKTHCG